MDFLKFTLSDIVRGSRNGKSGSVTGQCKRKTDLSAWWRHLIDEIRCRRHHRPFPCVRSP